MGGLALIARKGSARSAREGQGNMLMHVTSARGRNYRMLPIDTVRSEFVRAVATSQVVIVVGETGSGKTTQIPQFLFHAGYADKGIIGITEPRRLAVTSVARFVAQQLGSHLGGLVGYQVRFDSQFSDTSLKFMTDGILLREIQGDPDLSKYSVIVIDEAHERSQNIDFTLGLLKDLLKRRSDLKVIVTSATIDAEKFSRYFDGAPVIQVSGRTFPVRDHFLSRSIQLSDWRGRTTMEFMVEAVVDQITAIHLSGEPGDILVFMTGKDDINQVIRGLEAKRLNGLIALPVYGGMAMEEQDQVFVSYPGQRKVVVATNIAETSLTIDGTRYVVDSGLIKQNHFHSETGIQSLDTVPHSRAGCDQRKGRAGRTQPGICYRMYTEADYRSRDAFTEPEIRRVSLAGVVLAMEDIGITDVEGFDFLDSPDRKAFHEAYETLITLGAIAQGKGGITEVGRQMAKLPLEPRTARMLLEAVKFGCVKEVATIASFLSVNNVLARPKDKQVEADRAHRTFMDKRSDVVGYLNIWNQYVASGYSNAWCYGNFLNGRSLAEIRKVREQLLNVLEESGIKLSSTDDIEVVLKSVTAGLLYNLFRLHSRYAYVGTFRDLHLQACFIHPGSSVFGGEEAGWIVAAELVETTKPYLRCCTRVQLAWLREIAPHLFTEETMLDGFSEDGRQMRGRKIVSFCCRDRKEPIGQECVSLSLDEAREVQNELIRRAEEQGWTKVTFLNEVFEGGWQRLFVSSDGRYRASAYDTVLGVPYYCKTAPDGWYRRVESKFQVFKLPEPAAQPISQLLQSPQKEDRSQAPATAAAISALAERWGTTVTKKK